MTHNDIPSIDEIITDEWEYVSRFSRAVSLTSGELVDLSEPAKLFGFTEPVAFSHAAWVELIAEYCRGTTTKEVDRVNAVLLSLRDAVARKRAYASGRIYFRVVSCDGDGVYHDVALIATFGTSERPQPGIVVTLPEDE